MDYRTVFEYDFGFQIKWGSNGWGIGRCPNPHHEDKNPSCSFNEDNGVIYCHSCGYSKSAYSYAKEHGLDNPYQYIKIDGSYEYKPPTPLKSQNRAISKTKYDINAKKKENIERLPDELRQDSEFWGGDYGVQKDGRVTFHYANAIKIHKCPKTDKKPWWMKNDKADAVCQIFGLNRIDITKPVIIFEGEPDVIVVRGLYNAISFSHGAGKLPDDLTPLKNVPQIIVLGDNDDAGVMHNQNIAHQFYLMGIEVKIATWDESLPNGFDVKDDYKANGIFDETDKAIVNAVLYEPSETEINNNLGDFKIMKPITMINADIKPIEWYVDGILPKGFNSMIAGTTGSKKSLYAMQLAMCLANGEREFCGGKIDKQYKIMYVDTEAGEMEFQRRFQQILKHMSWRGNDYFTAISRHGRTEDIWESCHQAISHFKPDLIIIDCLYNSTSIGDFSKSNAMSKVTNALSDFKVKRGVDMLAIHHFTKGNHDVLTLDRISGASALQNWIEYAILMTRTNREELTLWQVGKARGVPHNPNVYGLLWDDFWFIEHGIIDDIQPFLLDKHAKNKFAQILEDLAERFDRKDWINVFSQSYPDLSERTGDTWLKKCLDARMVKKITKGMYQKHLRLINETNIDN
jgi:5S rRNA maturation endonuclease (ribonuclease M5)